MREKDKQLYRKQAGVWDIVLKGNQDALFLIDNLGFISQIWDDLIDKDNEDLTTEDINRAFWCALVEIPQNPFFKRYCDELVPIFRSSINAWFDANKLEKTNKHGVTLAFVLRDLVSEVIHQCSYIIGGYDWMREMSLLIRNTIFDETLEDYTNKGDLK